MQMGMPGRRISWPGRRATGPKKGGAVVEETVQAMTLIDDSSKRIADIIGTCVPSSTR